MDINQKINQIAIKYFDGNNVRFAEKMGTSEANIRNYRNKVVPKIDFLTKLHSELEISFDWLLVDEGAMSIEKVHEPQATYLLRTDHKKEIQRIPLYSMQAAASFVSTFNDSRNIIDYITIPNMPVCDGALPITGDSMYPLLRSGDIVMYKVVKDIKDGIFWGEMYLIYLQDNGDDMTLVKYVQKSDKGDEYIKIVSQNANHAPKDIKLKKVKAMALIKASIRINSMG